MCILYHNAFSVTLKEVNVSGSITFTRVSHSGVALPVVYLSISYGNGCNSWKMAATDKRAREIYYRLVNCRVEDSFLTNGNYKPIKIFAEVVKLPLRVGFTSDFKAFRIHFLVRMGELNCMDNSKYEL